MYVKNGMNFKENKSQIEIDHLIQKDKVLLR